MAKIVYTFRLALYTITLLLVSFLAVFIGIVCALLGQRVNTNYYVARSFWLIAGPIMGWKFQVEGEEYLWKQDGAEGFNGVAGKNGRCAVMLGNHQSFVDILYLGRIFPKHAAIMAKKELKWLPGLGWFMLLSGTVFINRSNNRSAVASMQMAGEDMMRKRISLWIFPEGTRYLSAENDLLPFKKGAFYLAVQSELPIIPVVCQNYHHLFDGKTRFRSGTLKIKVLPPISTVGKTTDDVPELMNQTRDAMVAALREISTPTATPRSSFSRNDSPTPLLHGDHAKTYAAVAAADPDERVSEETPLKGSKRSKRLSVAMVTDFFLPVAGGVEGHVYSLGIELMKRGHKVIVITHHHPPRTGVRYISTLKTYYLPIQPIASEATLPNYLLLLPYLRTILLREKIDLIHAHGSLSSMGHEAIYHAPLFGIRTVFTDHSLFGFGDAVGILTNKLLAGALRNVDAAICVSNTGRENTVLRGQIEPQLVSVIPNALIPENFRPNARPSLPTDQITIVVISRLVYRKGIDLLVACAPHICDLFPEVKFIVGGDGPKMVELEQMREKYQLQDRIELLGSVKPSEVCNVLTRGQIYLNTSLTEAFGISIIEAACAGLFVVSTRVGGVPEILPGDMIEFARADEDDVVRALSQAIRVIKSGAHDPLQAHERVIGMYEWSDVAARTEAVYNRALDSPPKDTFERLARYLSLGPFFGPILCCIMAVQHWFLLFLDLIQPRDTVERVETQWSVEEFAKVVHS
ncbi:hypothetical protein BD324DRAFT_641151 [Kockovaella imperatae]|uniref:1-acyl-sn-glycerol-3-phosphate acyltransferase n=1 Tax=Kockovaella imperatae TaxID=4999 RepID=A0A1Y1UQA5_9TREE|nr:hypothetical protein BD324DRAFT_641151 [Kockovaella imperatae]ORX40248.1 hypothetical protein BD324DRAFT_641151 [Kockovaella imperatae]